MTKTLWVQPKLVVLARSNPEEAVLGACKMSGVGPGTKLNGCKGNDRICNDKPCSIQTGT